MHLIALHDSSGSGNPLGVSGNYDRLPFSPYFIFKDLITIFIPFSQRITIHSFSSSTNLFLYIVYVQLVEISATSKYPWLTPQFFSDLFQTLFNRTYSSIKCSFNNPPRQDAFISLPLQSAAMI